MLAVDQAIFGAKLTVATPEVLFADGVQESQLVLAQTALALDQAAAASKKTIVTALHPEWDEQQVADEVALIKSEAPTVPDPTTFRPLGAAVAASPASGLPQEPGDAPKPDQPA